MLTVGSLFSGIGGIDLGLERAGMQIRWQVEIDPYCQQVLAKHWPDTKRYGDVRDLSGGELEPVDLICGGFPCQPVSQAGHRKGNSDERWLWPQFYRIVCEAGPKWVLVENVPGLISTDSGRLLSGILRDLAQARFDAEWGIVSAEDIGAPHLRQRVFILAHANGNGFQRKGVFRVQRSAWLSSLGSSTGSDSMFAGSSWPKEVDANQPPRSDWWEIEPRLGRMADGLPNQVDRLKCLGNAVVPQVAEYVGRLIMEVAER